MTRVLKAGLLVVQLAALGAVVDGIWRVSVPGALVAAGVLAFAVAELVDRGIK